jgi:hypothetical protein
MKHFTLYNLEGMTTMTDTTVAAPQTATTTWKIDPAHSVAEFKVKHMMIANVKGQFSKVSGGLFLDESGQKMFDLSRFVNAPRKKDTVLTRQFIDPRCRHGLQRS